MYIIPLWFYGAWRPMLSDGTFLLDGSAVAIKDMDKWADTMARWAKALAGIAGRA